MSNFKIVWTLTALNSLQLIYEFHLINSDVSAKKIVSEIYNAPDSIVFPNQYQIDSIYSKYRRIIIRDYKILYEYKYNVINIIDIISSKQNPEIIKNQDK